MCGLHFQHARNSKCNCGMHPINRLRKRICLHRDINHCLCSFYQKNTSLSTQNPHTPILKSSSVYDLALITCHRISFFLLRDFFRRPCTEFVVKGMFVYAGKAIAASGISVDFVNGGDRTAA